MQRKSTRAQKRHSMLLNECIVCCSDILNNSVLFHCECIVVICQKCARQQVAAQRSTFHDGVACPFCRKPSHNIQNINSAVVEENELVESAYGFFKIRQSRTNGAETNNLKRTLMTMNSSGLTGNISIEQLEMDEFDEVECLPALRLEVARLEYVRLHLPNTVGALPLPLGPLESLYFTRNMILERLLRDKTPSACLSSSSRKQPSVRNNYSQTESSDLNKSCFETSDLENIAILQQCQVNSTNGDEMPSLGRGRKRSHQAELGLMLDDGSKTFERKDSIIKQSRKLGEGEITQSLIIPGSVQDSVVETQDHHVLIWLLAIVQTLPILVNRRVPGKEVILNYFL
jgi:hypothetical protein